VGARRAAVRARPAPAGRARGGGTLGAGLGFGRKSLGAYTAAGRVRWRGARWAGPGSGGRAAEAGGASPTEARDPCRRARRPRRAAPRVVLAPRDPAGRRRQASRALSALALEGSEPAAPPAAPAPLRSQPARAAGGAAQRPLLLKGAGVPLGPSQWLAGPASGPAEAQRARGGADGRAEAVTSGSAGGAVGGAARAGARGGMRIQSPPSGAKTPMSPDVEGAPAVVVRSAPEARRACRLSRGVSGSAGGGEQAAGE
jgi:hypothetical protein